MSVLFNDECFANVVGVTRSECDCRTIPAQASLSDSDLFLFDLEGMHDFMADSLMDCDNATALYDTAFTAINEAVSHLKTDLISCLRSRSDVMVKRKPYAGSAAYIGDAKKANQLINLPHAYHGMKLQMADVNGGYALLRSIRVFCNQTTTLDIRITDNIGVTDETYAVTTTANQNITYTLPDPLELTMDNPAGGGYVEYYITYEPQAGMKMRDVVIDCGCGGNFKPYFNAASPQFNTSGDKGNYQWANWCSAGGTYGSDLSEATDWTTSNQTQGLALGIDFGCRFEKTICNGSLDYNSDPFAMVYAHAIRYKAGNIFLTNLSTSLNINLGNLSDGQTRANLANKYQQEYLDRVFNYLCPSIARPENLNVNSDCFACRNTHGFNKQRNLV